MPLAVPHEELPRVETVEEIVMQVSTVKEQQWGRPLGHVSVWKVRRVVVQIWIAIV